MTAGEMIEVLKIVPPDTPVVRMYDPWPGGWRKIEVRRIQVYLKADGYYGKFRSDKQQHRNDTFVVEVY